MESKHVNEEEIFVEIENVEDMEQLRQEQPGQEQPGQEQPEQEQPGLAQPGQVQPIQGQPGQDRPVQEEFKNAKEKLYDHIPVSIKVLDIIIGVLITSLVILLLYLIINSKSF